MHKAIFSGVAPTTVSLDTKAGYFKGKDYTATFEKEGYTKYFSHIQQGINGWYIGGNIFIGGLIGWFIVHPLTGSMWKLEIECVANLSPLTSSNIKGDSLSIVSIHDVRKNYYQK